MTTRSQVTATIVALLMAFGLFQLGSKINLRSVNLSEVDQEAFVSQVVERLNQSRNAQGIAELDNDPALQTWLSTRLDAFFDTDGKVNVSAMLDDLPLKIHTITNAAARTLEAKDTEGLLAQLDYWVEGYAEDSRLVAAWLYEAKRGKVGCALIAARSVPRFDLGLLNEGVTEFYNTCRHCDQPHLGTLSQVNLALAVNCPYCGMSYDLLAADMLGKYHRANTFLEGMRPPPGVGSEAETRYEEMLAIWQAAAEHCRYTVDLSGVAGEKDTWQKPSETYSFRNGDCEDSSLMLADWLESAGFETRVAIGHAAGQGGHAWVVVMVDGEQYVLESTVDEAPQNPPTPEIVADTYRPDFLFDRGTIYFTEKKGAPMFDYFDSKVWVPLSFSPVSSLENDPALAGESLF